MMERQEMSTALSSNEGHVGLSFGMSCGSVAVEIVTHSLTPDTAFNQNTDKWKRTHAHM